MIHISKIKTSDFLAHRELELDLPDCGVVIITGDNWAGKSSIVEAVAVALWGRTLRGTAWASAKRKPTVAVTVGDLKVVRSRSGSRNSLTWRDSSGVKEHSTALQAQDELTSIVGSFHAWRWTSVFSSQDVSAFSGATDAERKRLLEDMLGLSVFDTALSDCRRDLARARARVQDVDRQMVVMATKIRGARQRLEDARRGIGQEPEIGDSEQLYADTEQEARDRVRELRAYRRGISTKSADAQYERRAIQELTKRIDDVRQLDVCPTCEQQVTGVHKSAIEWRLKAELEQAEERATTAAAEVEELVSTAKECDVAVGELRKRAQELRDLITQHKQWSAVAERHNGLESRALQELRDSEGELLDLEDELDDAQADLEELEAVERVLGLRGVRAQVTSRALAGLEGVANVWLARLFPGVTVRIRPDTTLKSGKAADKICLDVQGLPHKEGYQGCSGGERRRIDVALLLALGEVRAGAEGATSGTIFLDECFDCLDGVGVEGVAQALSTVAQDRCVVVITHSQELASGVEAVARYRVHDGQISPA